MSHSDAKRDDAPDLLSLMTATDGRVLPHADCSRLTVALPEERETGGGGGDDKDLAERRRTRREQRKLEKAAWSPRSVRPAEPQSPQAPPGEAFLSVKQLSRRWNVGVATVWRWNKAGDIPKSIVLGPGTTRWRQSEILAFEASLEQGGAR
jgi:predicted DNA-binding transcriptional regulator AlpA